MSSSLFPAFDASASTVTVNYRDTGYFVTVDAPDVVNLSVDATPTGQTVVSSASTVNVVTNAPLGYKLYLTTENNELTASGISQTFSPTTAGTSISLNSWGFSLDPTATTGNVWNPVPVLSSSSSKPQYEASAAVISSSNTSNYPTGTNVNVYYGINSDTSMPSGTYSTTVTYTAFAEGIPLSVTNMQDFTYADCQNLTLEQTYYLTDSRDTKQYKIARLKDGNCWMQENLKLDGGRTLTSADSNVANDVTLSPTSNSGSSDATSMQIRAAQPGYDGNYYNWCAATATGNCSLITTEPNTSVCPKNWSLPNTANYAKIYQEYNVTSDIITIMESAPLYFSRSGLVNSSGYSRQGTSGFLWTRVPNASDSSNAYSTYYRSDSVRSSSNDTKTMAASVRCVLESRSLQDITYMQDMTSGICANTPEGTTKRLLDKRGYGNAGSDTTTTYGVIKAKDGNCWMTDNLNLYNKTLDAADSDFASGTFAIPASSTWNNNQNVARVHVGTGVGYSGINYYNFCSIVAENSCSEVKEYNTSICPKNWQLPNSGDETIDKSYLKLFKAYNLNSGSEIIAEKSLNFHYDGFWYYYGCSGAGCEAAYDYAGYFYTNNSTGSDTAKYLYFRDATLAYSVDGKGYGTPARCVAR